MLKSDAWRFNEINMVTAEAFPSWTKICPNLIPQPNPPADFVVSIYPDSDSHHFNHCFPCQSHHHLSPLADVPFSTPPIMLHFQNSDQSVPWQMSSDHTAALFRLLQCLRMSLRRKVHLFAMLLGSGCWLSIWFSPISNLILLPHIGKSVHKNMISSRILNTNINIFS